MPFLCTRVKDPDEDDWKKLLRMLKHLKETWQLELWLEADSDGVIWLRWSPDVAFAVHNDMRSHTGGALTLGARWGAG